ncbi:MAG: 3-phosphoshikimate 1-carboxyvinyltransferase [Actinomycetota bacterium]
MTDFRLPVAVGPIRATVVVPGSKSVANRVLVCAALADGTSRLSNLPDGDDTEAMLAGLERLGARIERLGGTDVAVTGSGTVTGGSEVDARLAGTTSRFLTAVAALGEFDTTITGEPALRARPMKELHDALRSLGAEVAPLAESGRLPVRVRRGSLVGGRVEMAGDVSSQFVTALMLVAPYFPEGLSIRLTTPLVSRPYVAMTANVMSQFGVEGIGVSDSLVNVEPGRYRPVDTTIEPDASSASYPLALAAICGGEVTVPHLTRDSSQGDVAIVDILGRMGCDVRFDGSGAVVVGGGVLRGIDIDMADVSDLVPTVAAVAAFAESPTTITGVGFIRGKESDRIGDLVEGLRSLGIAADALDDGLRVSPTTMSALHGAALSTHHDHRLAMAWSLVAARVDGITLDRPEVVSKSWPKWWDVRSTLLATSGR